MMPLSSKEEIGSHTPIEMDKGLIFWPILAICVEKISPFYLVISLEISFLIKEYNNN
jgi:hypothetical protein